MVNVFCEDGCKIYKGSPEANAWDLRSKINATIGKGETVKIPTGVYCGFGKGEYGLVLPRSSMGKKGIFIPNSPGLIDTDYRGEICVLLSNVGSETMYILPGSRIAQLMFQPDTSVTPTFMTKSLWDVFNKAYPTERGEGGFGSTGE